ncbi:hypothetical protein SCUP234_13171 [Seiridium cupressi]
MVGALPPGAAPDPVPDPAPEPVLEPAPKLAPELAPDPAPCVSPNLTALIVVVAGPNSMTMCSGIKYLLVEPAQVK